MLGGMYYKKVDIVFAFSAGIIDRWDGWRKLLRRKYTCCNPNECWVWRSITVAKVEGEAADGAEILHWTVQKIIGEDNSDHCNLTFYSLKFHLLDHIVEALLALVTQYVLDALPFKQFNVNMKHTYRNTSRRRDTGMNERVAIVGCEMDRKPTDLRKVF